MRTKQQEVFFEFSRCEARFNPLEDLNKSVVKRLESCSLCVNSLLQARPKIVFICVLKLDTPDECGRSYQQNFFNLIATWSLCISHLQWKTRMMFRDQVYF